MKKKRLNRDGWGFQFFPYYQIRIDNDDFHGLVCLIRIVEGEKQYWETTKAGKVAVCGAGMMWLQIIPDGKKRVITCKYYQDEEAFEGGAKTPEGEAEVPTSDGARKNYPSWAREEMYPSIWYVDVTEGIEYDENGIAVYIDKYLDVIFTPEGDVMVDDRDELDEAYNRGELTKEQYEGAIEEGESIRRELCMDIQKTASWCASVRRIAEKKIEEGHKPMYLFHGSKKKFDVLEPQKAHGESEMESLKAVYAGESLRDVIPFAVPIRAYPDGPGGSFRFSCDAGKMVVEYGYVDIDSDGYVYRVKPDFFRKIDEWEWVSEEPVKPIEVLTIPGSRMVEKISYSEKARKIQNEMFPEEPI